MASIDRNLLAAETIVVEKNIEMSCLAAEIPHPIVTDDMMSKYPGGCPFIKAARPDEAESPLTAINSHENPLNHHEAPQKDEEDEAEIFKDFHSKNTE